MLRYVKLINYNVYDNAQTHNIQIAPLLAGRGKQNWKYINISSQHITSLGLTEGHLIRLRPKQWLNDEIVDGYCALVENEILNGQVHGQLPKTVIVSSAFMPAVKSKRSGIRGILKVRLGS